MGLQGVRHDRATEQQNMQKGYGVAEDEMVRQHQQLNGHEFEEPLGDRGGQRSLACCSPWGCKESDMT